MEDKTLIITILKKLQWHWHLADGLLALVESVDMKQESYDALIAIFHKAYKLAHTADEKKYLERSLDLIQRIQQREKHDRELSDADIAHLLDEIDHA